MSDPVRIAMWSGPRNISTAMMRSWGNRSDTCVVDEPFYAFYLKETGLPHPGAAEVIAHGETDWRRVVASLTAEEPGGGNARIFYQKHMTHHMLPGIDRAWLGSVTNCFLIRHPARVIASYIRKNDEPTARDVGFPQQREIFDAVCNMSGRQPTVIDASDVVAAPEKTLRLLCEAVGVEFDPAMLSWPPGPRPTDGIWAKYWYEEVERTTSFAKQERALPELPAHLRGVLDECMAVYETLRPLRLR